MEVKEDLPDHEYHQSPALSYSTGKEYLRSPAHYRQKRDEPHKDTSYFDFGHVVHAGVLGTGMEVVEIPADKLGANGSVSTNAAKRFIQDVRDAGKVPMKAKEIALANAAIAAVKDHPEAQKYLTIPGQAEVPLFANDGALGVTIRGKVDWLPDPVEGRRTIPVDIKTTDNASHPAIKRAIAAYDYDLQAFMYRRLIRLARGDSPAPMVLIFVETTPPFGVNVIQLAHEDWITGGEWKYRRIATLHAQCTAANEWPSYPMGTFAITPPGWYLRQLDDLDEMEMDE